MNLKLNPTDCLIFMGRRGCGKSYFAKRVQKNWPRRVVIDSMHEYERDKKNPNSFVVNSFGAFCEKLNFFKENKTKKFELIYQYDINSDISDDEFNEIMKLCFYFGNIQVVIEEIQLYATAHQLPKWLKNLLMIGRHQNISVLCTSQRPGQVNKGIISQCAHVFCGQLIDRNDLNYVSAFLNEDSKKLTSLQKKQFIWFSDQGTKLITNEI